MSSTPADLDACPRCGTHVQADGSYGIGAAQPGDELPEPTQQARTCPSCGAELRRAVGSSWSVVPEPWRVIVHATPHDSVLRQDGQLIGMLVRGSSFTPTEMGLGPGRYEFEVVATDAESAQRAVEEAAARQQVTIHQVDDVRHVREGG